LRWLGKLNILDRKACAEVSVVAGLPLPLD
jgi:hypothetical protein